MELSQERDASAIGNLFQQIINDMKNAGPIWEDFVSKASKLHACLRATIQAISAYLDVFQKIADAATNSKGATKEIGTALTRICLRHKSVETRMKTFTSTIMDSLIIPLQNKLDDWQRQTSLIDKEYAKEHKRCRTELKKRSTDTLRLKKKAKRGQTDQIQSMIETSMLDISAKRDELDAVDRKSLREVMVEERHRYCAFVHMLQPVVKEECDIMYELGHLREAMDSIAIVTKDPATLPELSENMILELRAPPSATVIYADPLLMGTSQTTRCSISTGSRKSSVGSINSLHSSDSRECPPAGQYQRSISQFISPVLPRLTPGESKDSGFSSTSILTTQTSTASSNASHAISTWPPHSVDAASAAVAAAAASATNAAAGAAGTPDRPHTISSAYEKGHQRPALTVYTFQSPDAAHVEPLKMSANLLCRPPLPVRCSSLERPLSGNLPSPVPATAQQPPQQRPSAIPAHITKDTPVAQPTYVNTADLATLTAHKYAYPINAAPAGGASNVDQVNSPVMSIGSSSRASTDSLIATQHSSPDHSGADKYQLSYIDSPVSTGTNTNTTTTPTATGANAPAAIGTVGAVSTTSSSLDVTAVDSTASSVASSSDIAGNGGHESGGTASADRRTPADDFKSIGSVLEKLSIFEKIKSFNGVAGGPATGSSSFSTSPSSDSTSASLTLHKQQQQQQAVGTFKLDACALKQQQQQQQHQHQQQPHHRNDEAVPAETVGRTTRRSSFNNAKPPPPVRRSSSVTPSHQMGPVGHPGAHHQQLNSSSESLPPPPQYLLSTTSGRTSPGKVCETIKALTEIRHMPASPGVIRRAQILQQQQQQQQMQLQQQQLLQQAHPVQPRTYLAANHASHQHTDTTHTTANISSFGAPAAASVASVAAVSGNHSSNVSSFKNSISDAAQRYSQKKSNSSVLAQLNARINKYTAENNAAISAAAAAAAASMPKANAQPAQPTQQHLHSYAPAPHQQQQQHQEYAHIDAHHQQQQQLYATQQQLHQQQLQQQQQQQQQQLYHHQQQQLQQHQQQQQQFHHTGDQHEVIYSRPTENTNPFHQPQATWNQRASSGATFGHHRATSAEPAAPMRNERTGRCKAESAFLQNLNSRLAEQAMSGKAFAVRNLINSKALPDPRICHESLMDQIKRGATLTRNKSINDRSAPKIYKK